MKILSILFISLSFISLGGNAIRIIQGESIVFGQALVGTICILLLAFTCTWCWRKSYRAPWVLFIGMLFIILGINGVGMINHYSGQLTKADNIVDLFFVSLFFIVGVSVSLWSKKLHKKRAKTS